VNRHRPAIESCKRVLEQALNRLTVRLTLPPDEPRAVVRECELENSHQSTTKITKNTKSPLGCHTLRDLRVLRRSKRLRDLRGSSPRSWLHDRLPFRAQRTVLRAVRGERDRGQRVEWHVDALCAAAPIDDGGCADDGGACGARDVDCLLRRSTGGHDILD